MKWYHIKASMGKKDKLEIVYFLQVYNEYTEQEILVEITNRDEDDPSESRDKSERNFLNARQ